MTLIVLATTGSRKVGVASTLCAKLNASSFQRKFRFRVKHVNTNVAEAISSLVLLADDSCETR